MEFWGMARRTDLSRLLCSRFSDLLPGLGPGLWTRFPGVGRKEIEEEKREGLVMRSYWKNTVVSTEEVGKESTFAARVDDVHLGAPEVPRAPVRSSMWVPIQQGAEEINLFDPSAVRRT